MGVAAGRVQKTSGAGGTFAGHRVVLSYSAGMASGDVDSDGRFQLTVPDDLSESVEVALAAPTGVVVERRTLTPAELGEEIVLVATPASPIVVVPDETIGRPRRLAGRVIGPDGTPATGGLPVVVWGVDDEAGAAPRPRLSVTTQAGGHFAAPWPSVALIAAYGEVAGRRAPIALEDGRLPRRVILVVPLPVAEEDCGCAPTPPRAPDPDDLASNSEAFSQDLGGGCVNLTMPNRVLEEFSYFTIVRITEPSVRPMNTEPPQRLPPKVLGQVTELATKDAELPAAARPLLARLDAHHARELLATPTAVGATQLVDAAVRAEATDVHRLIDLLRTRPARSELDGRKAIDWDSSPTVFEATSVASGHVLHYRQVWRADGYSLGDLLYSLPLAPGQKRLLSVLDWTRRSAGERTESLESEERMLSLVERDRDISEIVGSHLDERIDGGSRSTQSAAGAGIGAAFTTGAFGVVAGVAGGASSSSSSSWQDSSRELSANSLQQLRDRTTQRAAAVRSTRSTVIQATTQGETVRAETDVVANHNHCHAITVEYFEVLRHFQISEELVAVSECLFVPLPMLPFDRAKARRWRAALLQSLRVPELGSGFDASERIATNWDGWDYPKDRYSEEAPEELDAELRVTFVIPRPRDDLDGLFQIDQWNWLTPYLWSSPLGIFNQMADHVNNLFRDINRAMTAEFTIQIQRARDEYFAKEVAPRIAEQIVRQMRFGYVTRTGIEASLPMDATLISKYFEGVPLYVSVRASGSLPATPREQIHRFRVALGNDTDVVPAEARVIVNSGRGRYRTANLEHEFFDAPRVNNDLSDGDDVVIPTPTSHAERRNPRSEDRKAADRLVKHLNEHLEYYHQALWTSLDPQRRYLLLDGVIAPNSGGRSVASVVENRLIGIVGNAMVLPVTPGIHLDPTVAPNPETGERVDLIHAYAAEPPPPTRISVPTRGVYAEAIMGECNSCELKDDTRFWRWEESPLPDDPTPIEPLSTESRRSDDPDLSPTPMPQPIVNIQNAPALPDPVGLTQALQILGRSDIFREASGLAGTQRNALSAFQGVMDTAQQFGGMAAKLAQQGEMSRNVDRTMEQIKGAAASGLLSKQQAQDLSYAALEALAGDGGAAAQNPVHDPQVAAAISRAAESGSGSVTVTSPEETIAATFDDTPAGGGVSVGRSFSAHMEPPANHGWLNTGLLLDDRVSTTPPEVKYQFGVALTTRDELRNHLRQLVSGVAVDWLPALETEGLLRPTPGSPIGFQLALRLQVCYPTEPGKAGIGGTGKLPVVILQHGRHRPWQTRSASAAPTGTFITAGGATIPQHTGIGTTPNLSLAGYTTLQEELARNGIVSVSVDARVPDIFDQLLETRYDLIVETLNHLAAEAVNSASVFFGRLDLDRVGLFGHSRGGDAVVKAAKEIAGAPQPHKYSVKAVCSLAPTDFTGDDTPTARMTLTSADTDFYLVLYGALDGDVSALDSAAARGGSGFRHYDRALCPKSMMFLARCNHNSFNAVWHADGTLDSAVVDSDPAFSVIDEAGHRQVLTRCVGEFFRWRLKNEPLAGRFDGRVAGGLPTPVSLQWQFGTYVAPVDDGERGATTNNMGGAVTLGNHPPDVISIRDENQVTRAGAPPTPLGTHMPHQSHLLQLGWESTPRAPGVTGYSSVIPAGKGDWSDKDLLLLISLAGFHNPTDQATVDAEWFPRVRILLTDDTNKTAVLDFSGYGAAVPSKPTWTRKRGRLATLMRLETVPIPVARFTGIRLNAVTALALELEPAGIITTYIDNIHLVKR